MSLRGSNRHILERLIVSPHFIGKDWCRLF